MQTDDEEDNRHQMLECDIVQIGVDVVADKMSSTIIGSAKLISCL